MKLTIRTLIEKENAVVELSSCKLSPVKAREFLEFKKGVKPFLEDYTKKIKEAFDKYSIVDKESPNGFKFETKEKSDKFNKEQEKLVNVEITGVQVPRIRLREIHSSISPNTLGALLDFIIFE